MSAPLSIEKRILRRMLEMAANDRSLPHHVLETLQREVDRGGLPSIAALELAIEEAMRDIHN